MVSIPARTVDEYLAKLPPERRAVVSAVRQMVKRHMPKGYVEQTGYGMIGWVVPLSTCPDTYNGEPLCYAGIAAQKHHYSLYLTGVYLDPILQARVRTAFARAGKRLDMGKSCIRFRSLDAIPLEALGKLVAAVPVQKFIKRYTAIHAATRTAKRKAAGSGSATRSRKAAKAAKPVRRAKAVKRSPRAAPARKR